MADNLEADGQPNSATKVKAVYDRNVFLQGLINARSPANKCLHLWLDSIVHLYTSRPILLEIRDVLLRPELQEKFATLTYERVETLFQTLKRQTLLLEAVPTHFRLERDTKDEPYLNLAIAAKPQYIVSRDKDLLGLMSSADRVSRSFRASYPQIAIMEPAEFLAIFSGPQSRT